MRFHLQIILGLIAMDLAQIRMQDKTEFKCDEKEKLDELMSIRRFLINNDQIYMFLKNKILTFKISSLLSQANVRVFEQFYSEDEEKSNKIIGYFVNNKIDEKTSDTYELQEEDKKSKFKIYKFDFNRMTKIELDYANFEKLFHGDGKLNLSKINEDANFEYIYLNGNSNSGVKQRNGYQFKFKENKIFLNLIKNGNLITIRNRPFENNYQIEFAAGYMEDANSNKISIIQIDSELNFYISQFILNQINETYVQYQLIEKKLNNFKSTLDCSPPKDSNLGLKSETKIGILIAFGATCFILVGLLLMCSIYRKKQTGTKDQLPKTSELSTNDSTHSKLSKTKDSAIISKVSNDSSIPSKVLSRFSQLLSSQSTNFKTTSTKYPAIKPKPYESPQSISPLASELKPSTLSNLLSAITRKKKKKEKK